MTAPLDEKGLEAAEVAWRASVAPTCKLMLTAAIRAYLAASPSPSEMEVVAWLDETADAAPGAKGVTTDAYTAAYWEHTSGAPMTELVRASQAQSALVAMRDEVERLTKERDVMVDINRDLPRRMKR